MPNEFVGSKTEYYGDGLMKKSENFYQEDKKKDIDKYKIWKQVDDGWISQTAVSQLPDTDDLEKVLTAIFERNKLDKSSVKIIDRKVNVEMSTFLSEIIKCVAAEKEFKILVKYESGHRHNSRGHRGRIPYEVKVYEYVLESLRLSKPNFYGGFKYQKTGDTWLFIEYIERSRRIQETKNTAEAVSLAANWIGKFHAHYERNQIDKSKSFLKKYNTEYYAN